MDRLYPLKIKSLKFIKTLKDYENVLRYNFRFLTTESSYFSIGGNFISVRWSIKKKEFVLDFNTNKKRDIEGISIECIESIIIRSIIEKLNNNKEVCKKLNLYNEYKLLVFEVNENNFQFFGIWNRHNSEKREGSYDLKKRKFTLFELKSEIEHTLSDITGFLKKENVKINFATHRLFYDSLLNSTLDNFNDTARNVFDKNKNVKSDSKLYNIICEDIENKILDIINVDKIYYINIDEIYSISRKLINNKVLEEKKEELPLGIFTI